MTTTTNRNPYVGDGEDGARRSARIDREEVDGLAWDDPRRDELLASAQRWEDQAHQFVRDRLGPRPTLAQVHGTVGNEDWLAGLALLELAPALATDAGHYTEWSREGRHEEAPDGTRVFHPDPLMDWQAWVSDVDTAGRGWSSTEWRLFDVIAAIVIDDRPLRLRGTLDNLGSWEAAALGILVEWASGGNQREHPGRVTTMRRDRR